MLPAGSLETEEWYMSYRFADSLWAEAFAPAHKLSVNLYDIYHSSTSRLPAGNVVGALYHKL